MTNPRTVLLNLRDAQHVLDVARKSHERARESFKECFRPDEHSGMHQALEITAMNKKKMEITLGFCEDMIFGATVRPPAVTIEEDLLRKALLQRGLDSAEINDIIKASTKAHDVYYGRHRKDYFARFV